MSFQKSRAELFTDNAIKLSLATSEKTSETFYGIYESLYSGTFFNPETNTDSLVHESFEAGQSSNRERLKRAIGNYPISSVYAEYLMGFIASKNLKNQINDFVNGECKMPEEIKAVSVFVDKDANIIEDKIEEIDQISFASKGYSEDSFENNQDVSASMFLFCKNNPAIKYILLLSGRFKRIYENIKRTMPGTNPEIPDSYILSGDIENALPEHFAMLSNGTEEDKEMSEAMENFFWFEFVNESLMCQDFISKEEKGSGDFHMFIDYSGSMAAPMPFCFAGLDRHYNTRLNWAYGLSAAIVDMVKKESKNKRKIFVTMFADTQTTFEITDMNVKEFIMALMRYNDGAGTNVDGSLFRFANDCLHSNDNKFDGILISDGQFAIREATFKTLSEARIKKSLNIFSIYIGCDRNQQLENIFPLQSLEIKQILTTTPDKVAGEVSRGIVRDLIRRAQ